MKQAFEEAKSNPTPQGGREEEDGTSLTAEEGMDLDLEVEASGRDEEALEAEVAFGAIRLDCGVVPLAGVCTDF